MNKGLKQNVCKLSMLLLSILPVQLAVTAQAAEIGHKSKFSGPDCAWSECRSCSQYRRICQSRSRGQDAGLKWTVKTAATDTTAAQSRAGGNAKRNSSLALMSKQTGARDLLTPVQIPGASPFGALENCGNFPGIFNGVNFVDSEVEPCVDVNPANSNNIVAFWQQDLWSDGGARGNVAGVSLDGGASWQIVPVPGLTECSGGLWERASDPWVSFSPDGTLHQMSLVFQSDPAPGSERGFGANGMAVSKSDDGGLTWSNPILIAADDGLRYLNDKNSLTADPTNSNFVYAVWDRLDVSPGAIKINQRDRGGLDQFKGQVMFARSTDGGETWEPARRIYSPDGLNQTIGNQIVVLPDGTVIDFFNEILNFRSDDGGSRFDFNLAFKYSENKGQRWLPHGQPIRANKIQSLGVITPDDEVPVRDASILFDVAVDSGNGNLYAVWQDARFSGVDEIAFSLSSDGGATWSIPAKINQTPANTNPLRSQAFLPSVAVTDDGIVGVTYYDFRNDDDTGELADYFVIICVGGCSDPANWEPDIRLNDNSIDYVQAPFANGLFLGEHVGLASDGIDFLSIFGIVDSAESATIFFSRVTP
jgi:hypothetical protein